MLDYMDTYGGDDVFIPTAAFCGKRKSDDQCTVCNPDRKDNGKCFI